LNSQKKVDLLFSGMDGQLIYWCKQNIFPPGTQTDQKQEVVITAENGSTIFFSIKPTKVGYIMLKVRILPVANFLKHFKQI
jgi:hypothetical protein